MGLNRGVKNFLIWGFNSRSFGLFFHKNPYLPCRVSILADIMDSLQSNVSKFKNSLVAKPEKDKSEFFKWSVGSLSKGIEVNGKKAIYVTWRTSLVS